MAKAWRIVLLQIGRTSWSAVEGSSELGARARRHCLGRQLPVAAQSLSHAILERLAYCKRFESLEP